MATPRQHIEQIRKTKFSIGGEANPLIEDLHQATKHLSAELYTKDVHFFMELIQNAEDNEYPEGVDPSLEFVITSSDITGTGAPATLLVFNNEKGFSPKNIESVCSVGRSTKKGHRKGGYIGEKGIGFKSVFLITAQPYVFSNGYQIRFTENPCQHCGLGYIVPEWVEATPSLSDIKQVYGSGASSIPTTTLILPLKADKIKAVKEQLSTVHPEVLLFLSKIKRLSVREANEDPRLNTVCAIAITSETNFVSQKNIDAESYTIHLSATESTQKSESQCSYYMWKQRFPVKKENKVERRSDTDEWVITLAFPNHERLNRGMSSPGVYAFLPTEMVTNFPFIIQGDFLLSSSRETILLDDKWNQGILECVPAAFTKAFIALVRMTDGAPASSLARMFDFLPVKISDYTKLNGIRDSIRANLLEESIIPCESYTDQKLFHRPCEVGRLKPAFWSILEKARKNGVVHNLSSHGCYILNSSFDKAVYNDVLNFLEIKHVNNDWYTKCIQSSNLVLRLSEDLYIQLLNFVADCWSELHCTSIKSIPLLKYDDINGDVSLCCINDCLESAQRNDRRKLYISKQERYVSWLIDSNQEFGCVANQFFMPRSFHTALFNGKKEKLWAWLVDTVKVAAVEVDGYATITVNHVNGVAKIAVAFCHFLFHSLKKGFLSAQEVSNLCSSMPLVDNYGSMSTKRNGILVPSNGSKWVNLISSNPWRGEGYVELGEEYLSQRQFAGETLGQRKLITFLVAYAKALDIPLLSPPNVEFPTFSAPLTKENALLLLGWIHSLRERGISIPSRFMKCIVEGCWLRVMVNGSPTYKPPAQSFHLASTWGNVLQSGSVFVDIPLLDVGFYGDNINQYKEELRMIGVMLDVDDACEYMGKHLRSLADNSTFSREKVISILRFIRYLTGNSLSPNKFIESIKAGKWLVTSQGIRSPVGSVLRNQKWFTASEISNLPFVDQEYYGKEMLNYQKELQSLGIVTEFNNDYKLLADNLKSPCYLTSLSSNAFILMLECIRHLNSPSKIIEQVKNVKCLKSNAGYKIPGECFLLDPEWGSLLLVFNNFALADEKFYGSRLLLWKHELKQIGVVVNFEDAVKAFAGVFKKSTMTKENAFSFLSCYRKLGKMSYKLPLELMSCFRDEKWLQTRMGARSPGDCVLNSSAWKSISSIAQLPFINDNFYGCAIYEFEKELRELGVAVEAKAGLKFVFSGLSLPQDPTCISKQNVLSVLDFIRLFLQEKNSLPDDFKRKLSEKWLKTYMGYETPQNCILFGPEWVKHLKPTDGPFLDQGYYGSDIGSYRTELAAIGLMVSAEGGCPLVAKYLAVHSEFSTIVRIYKFLKHCNWKPDSVDAKRIWVPEGNNDGKWVNATDCVLHDKHDLFGSKFNVLEKWYEPELVVFFSKTFDVKSNPSLDDYCKLWKEWETSSHRLSQTESLAFWGCVLKHTSAKSEKTLADSLSKLPILSDSDTILLIDKRDVFIADDLQLKDLFDKNSPHPIFVWYPQPSMPSLPRTQLLQVYSNIGVRKISEAVQKDETLILDPSELKQVNPFFNKKGMIKVILGLLASPPLNMEVEARLAAVQRLLKLTVFETQEPVLVSYCLTLSSGDVVNAKAMQMIWWDKESSKLVMQKRDKDGGQLKLIEYATYFSEEISKGLLWDKEDHISALAALIKLAVLLDFDEDATDFLMKSKNLQIFVEDVEYLSAAFPAK